MLEQPVPPELLAVVGRDHHERVPQQAPSLEAVQQPPHIGIQPVHRRQVRLPLRAPLRRRESLRPPPRGLVAVVPETVWARPRLGAPGRHRRGRGQHGDVGIEVVGEDEERPRPRTIEPAEHGRVQLCRRLAPGQLIVVSLPAQPVIVEQGGAEPGGQEEIGRGPLEILVVREALREALARIAVQRVGNKPRRAVAAGLQHFRQRPALRRQRLLPSHREAGGHPAGKEAGMRRQGPRRGGDGAVEHHPAPSPALEVGRGGAIEPVQAEVTPPHGVEHQEQDVGRPAGRRRRGRRPAPARQHRPVEQRQQRHDPGQAERHPPGRARPPGRPDHHHPDPEGEEYAADGQDGKDEQDREGGQRAEDGACQAAAGGDEPVEEQREDR